MKSGLREGKAVALQLYICVCFQKLNIECFFMRRANLLNCRAQRCQVSKLNLINAQPRKDEMILIKIIFECS